MYLLAPALVSSAPPPLPAAAVAAVGLLWIVLALFGSACFATLRAALQRALPSRVLAATEEDRPSERVGRLLERAERLASSAAILKIACDLVFVALLLDELVGDEAFGLGHAGLMIAIAMPAIVLLTEAIPAAIARTRGDALLLRVLPTFYVLQLPIGWVAASLDAVRRSILRVLGLADTPPSTRKIVEGLREVIEESDHSGDLDALERQMLQNVMEFGEVDVAAVMTPRTELYTVQADEGLDTAAQTFVEAGHSRIPVYEESVDTIIGTLTALEVTKAIADGKLGKLKVRDLMRPPFLVPETKHIAELLAEFRAKRQKMAIVLDEYGGTAGIVTLVDVVAEIVGDIQDEFEEDEPDPVKDLGNGVFEVIAGLHVTDVNETLDLTIPEEEDYETLGGFMLAQLGHLPKAGESFKDGDVEFAVAEASDRRVLKVTVKRSA